MKNKGCKYNILSKDIPTATTELSQNLMPRREEVTKSTVDRRVATAVPDYSGETRVEGQFQQLVLNVRRMQKGDSCDTEERGLGESEDDARLWLVLVKCIDFNHTQ